MPHKTVTAAIFIKEALKTSRCSQNDICSRSFSMVSFIGLAFFFNVNAFHAFFEETDAPADTPHHFGNFLSAKEQENNQGDE